MRIFIGLVEIAGHYGLVTQHLIERGYTVDSCGPGLYDFKRKNFNKSLIPKTIENCKYHIKRYKSPKLRHLKFIIDKILNIVLLLWVLFRCDVVILYGGAAFTSWQFDLLLLNLFRKRIIINMCHGSEARPPYFNGKFFPDIKRARRHTKRFHRKVSAMEKYSDVIVCLPVLSQFFKKKLVHRDYIGKPVDLEINTPKTVSECIQVCHIPSDLKSKGSDKLACSLKKLIKNNEFNKKVNFTIVENVSNEKVKQVLANSDIIITQLYSDIQSDTTSLEAIAHDCWPIICGAKQARATGYLRIASISDFITTDDLDLTLKRLIVDDEYRNNKLENAKSTLKANWSIDKVTDNYLKLIENHIPKYWFFNPLDFDYVAGYGMQTEDRILFLRRYILEFGTGSLCLNHNKNLLERIQSELCKDL